MLASTSTLALKTRTLLPRPIGQCYEAEAEVYWPRLRPLDRGQYFGLGVDAEAKSLVTLLLILTSY